jgi:hypothetical protein
MLQADVETGRMMMMMMMIMGKDNPDRMIRWPWSLSNTSLKITNSMEQGPS